MDKITTKPGFGPGFYLRQGSQNGDLQVIIHNTASPRAIDCKLQ